MNIDKSLINDPIEFAKETSAERYGRRIRDIRTTVGMTQAELGEKVGLSPDRIQKYENGARKPKDEMVKNIANALGVNPLAIVDPVASSYVGAMFVLFELENVLGFKLEKRIVDDVPMLSLNLEIDNPFYKYMVKWYDAYIAKEASLAVLSLEEERDEALRTYKKWKWCYSGENQGVKVHINRKMLMKDLENIIKILSEENE